MKPITVGSELTYQCQSPTVFLLNISVAQTDHQKILDESLTVDPPLDMQACQIGLGQNRTHRVLSQAGMVTFRYKATVQLNPVTQNTPQIEQEDYASLPPDVLTYLNPSRYCESDRLTNYALSEFGHLAPNFDRVNAICDWIYQRLAYRSGTTDSSTTACDVLLQRQGVCRDFAHLAISFCRALGIPARYVSGYACRLQPPDFHGFFEAYLGGHWFLFDATRLAPPAGLVRIGVGRDAADTAFCTIWGTAMMQNMSVWADEQQDEQLLNREVSEIGVSTA